ncbi:MAG: hypothetical protein A2015_00135 [Spirochaetes bacterium GWF1_31_7]|nr:MAG: hypothetical protein A2Y30_04375 [Spirochaetes bacterium GWE1_32_154]OHD45580.1 MAG: hypothetical protein A2Y29_10330 [Spirochaetes bacterium GWE2_31_10]OHD50998.1 MAG: hypothetical protein A2015_00135 [Spirochaetes bacterium GWF1_31_7]HBD94313.1 hypothetical protein [Spirochaetia bacterium]HBI37932.1 hypothetical protein [Spirochaetia bacterium]
MLLYDCKAAFFLMYFYIIHNNKIQKLLIFARSSIIFIIKTDKHIITRLLQKFEIKRVFLQEALAILHCMES